MKIDRYLFLFVLGLTVGVALFACAAGAASDVPEIVTDPTSGGPGTRVTIRGSGFPADTELNVRLGPPNVGATPQSYGHALSDAAGEFVISLILPGQWPDGTPITERDLLVVIINDDGSIKAVAPFCFEPADAAQPALSLTPGNGTPGEQVLVNGHYFRAGARVGLRLGVPETGPGNVKLAEVQVDDSGAFETTLAIPTTWTDSGAAITEQDLSIAAVDESVGQTLATVSFFNFEGRAASDGAANEPPLDPVHTDDAGDALRLASAPEPDIIDVALVWTYDGDGDCQMATFGSETVAFGVCGAALMSAKYAVPERAEALAYFVETFLPFEAETPAGSVRFSGHGTSEAPPAVQRMMAEWARLAQTEAWGGRSGAAYGLALAWHREGESAGFCEDLTIYVSGDVFASSCRGEQPQNVGRGRLTAVQLAQLYAWVDGLENFELEGIIPATAEASTLRLVFSGRGSGDATDADKHAIGDFAAHLFQEITVRAEDFHSPGVGLPPGPRLVVQRPDGSIQYLSLDGTTAVLVADAPASLRPAGFDSVPMTDGPMVYLRQWWGGFYVLDTPLGQLFPLDFIPMDSSPLAVRPLTEGLLPDDSPISLAWGEFSAAHVASARLYLAAPDGSHKAEVLKASYDTSDPWTQFVPWRWRQDGRLYFTKAPIDGMGGFRPFTNAANLWVLDPSSGTGTELVSDDVTGGQLCLDALAPDDRLLAHHCNQGQITLLDLETGMATSVGWPDQTIGDALPGSVRFSPDGSCIAYAVMTGGFGMIEQTRGYVAVSDSLSGGSHIVAMSELGQWFSVAAWLSRDWLVLQSQYAGPDGWPAVWIVRTDGSGLNTLADGVFLAKFDG